MKTRTERMVELEKEIAELDNQTRLLTLIRSEMPTFAEVGNDANSVSSAISHEWIAAHKELKALKEVK